MIKTLAQLAAAIPGSVIIGDPDISVNIPQHDSREVEPGNLFCAIKGESFDGNAYIQQAIERGASAVLSACTTSWGNTPGILVENDRKAMAIATHILYDNVADKLNIHGLTGTNGKSTSVSLLQHVLSHAGSVTGRIGTLGWNCRNHSGELSRTTPESPDLLRIIHEMYTLGAKDIAMEVASIAMPMHRVDGLHFASALFTNFSQDHLGYSLHYGRVFQGEKTDV